MASHRQTFFEYETCHRLFNDMLQFHAHNCDDAGSGGYDPDTLFSEGECLDLQPTETQHQPSTSAAIPSETPVTATPTIIWTRPDTLSLIDLYKQNEPLVKSGVLRKKAMWAKIANSKELKSKVTPSQCEGRWKTLVRGMKNVSDHNKKSGNERKNHPYEEELSFLLERPNISPVYVASTATASTEEDKSEGEGTSATSTASATGTCSPVSKRRKISSKASEVVDVMQSYIKTQQERYDAETKRSENMHKERMELFREFLNVLAPNTVNKSNEAEKEKK